MILAVFRGSCRSWCVSIAGHISQRGWIPGWALIDFLIFQIAPCGGNACGTSPLCPTACDDGFWKNVILSVQFGENLPKTQML